MSKKILAMVRLRAYANTDRANLIKEIERVAHKYNIRRQNAGSPYPVEFRKEAPPPYLKDLQNDLEKLGFKFKRLPIHSPETQAVRSDGSYASVDYLLDIVFRHDELTVELYY